MPRRTAPRSPLRPLAVGLLAAGLAAGASGCSSTNSPDGGKDVTVPGPVQSLGSSGSPSASGSSSGAASASSSPSGSASGLPSQSVSPAGVRTVTVQVRGTTVTPAPGRVEVDAGSQVRLVVTSDVANEVHVHGVDLTRPVQAGRPTTVDFTPTESGTYEVELHDPALLLFKLSVR